MVWPWFTVRLLSQLLCYKTTKPRRRQIQIDSIKVRRYLTHIHVVTLYYRNLNRAALAIYITSFDWLILGWHLTSKETLAFEVLQDMKDRKSDSLKSFSDIFCERFHVPHVSHVFSPPSSVRLTALKNHVASSCQERQRP